MTKLIYWINTDSSVYSLTYGSKFKVFYTNSNQLLNKRDYLLMQIAEIPPDIISIIEVISKAQIKPFDKED